MFQARGDRHCACFDQLKVHILERQQNSKRSNAEVIYRLFIKRASLNKKGIDYLSIRFVRSADQNMAAYNRPLVQRLFSLL